MIASDHYVDNDDESMFEQVVTGGQTNGDTMNSKNDMEQDNDTDKDDSMYEEKTRAINTISTPTSGDV